MLILIAACAWASQSSAKEPSPQSLAACDQLLSARSGDKATALCFYSLASSDDPGANAAAQRIEEIAEQRSDLPWFTYYEANLRWADTEASTSLYRRAIRAFHKQQLLEGEVYSRINLSNLLSRMGKEEASRKEMERVLELTSVSDDPELRSWGRVTMARRLWRDGEDLARAYELLREVAGTEGADVSTSLRRDRLVLLGNVCLKLGRLSEAERAFGSLSDIAAETGQPFLEANARYNLASVAYERLRDLPTPSNRRRAVESAKEALQVAIRDKHRSVEAQSAFLLGVLTQGKEADRYLRHCLRAAENADLQSYCLNRVARRRAADDPDGAWKLLDRSMKLANESADGWSEARVWETRIWLSWEIEPPDKALETSWTALDRIERLRNTQPVGSDAQAGLFSLWNDDYAWLVGRLIKESGQGLEPRRAWSEAFRVEERSRSRALIDWLRRADPGRANAWPPSSVETFPELDEVRAALAPDQALLSFQVAPWKDLSGNFGGGSWLMVVTRSRVSVHRLPGRASIRQAVRLFEGLVERRDGSEAGPGARLFETLLAPALSELPPEVTRLILVPDDALHRLPFAALRPTADGQPLGARYEIVRVPSATLWLHWRSEEPAPAKRPVLVLADPALSGGALRSPGDESAPSGPPGRTPGRTQLAQVRGADGGSTRLGDQPAGAFGPLTYAREEGRTAVRDLGGGLFLAGPEATEERVDSLDLSSFGLIHFAAHAVTDENRPERSAVLLASDGTGEGGSHDGRLESAEIAHLHLGGRTVVLASCRSADGTVLRGEGVMSLARAFFQAGAHGVVASLWPLRDDESAALFRRFYRHLAAGETVAGALHTARQEAIAAGEPAAAWAGLVVLGDGALVPVPGGRWVGPPAGLITVAAVVLLAALVLSAWLWGALRRRSR